MEVFGELYGANSLGEISGKAVDLIHFFDPDAIQQLSEFKTKSRHLVSKSKTEVHLKKPSLPTHQTQSGWWVSKNVSLAQTRQSFKKLCQCAGLVFGEDIRFPA